MAEVDGKWSTGEKILCFHGPLIYEAKIQNIEVQNGIPKYLIHYHGWNKNWDEWVAEARMLKHSEKNLNISKDLVQAHEVKDKIEKRRRGVKRKADEECGGEPKNEHVFAVPRPPTSPQRARRKAGLRPQKREVKKAQEEGLGDERLNLKEALKPPDNTVESEDIFKSKVEIRIRIPDELKSYLVDDWEQIVRHKNLCVLPARLTVDQLLDNYTRAKTANKSELASKNNREKAILEVAAGLREYFNVMLPCQLLFKQEKNQFQEMKKDDPSMMAVKVYGAPHFLRLFTKIGETLVYTPLSEKSINILLFYLHDILNYMKKNSSIIFSNSDYAPAVTLDPLPPPKFRTIDT